MLFNTNKKAPLDAAQQLKDAQHILSTLKPVLDKANSNKATYMVSKGFDFIEEYIYYILAIASFIFIFIMNSVFPFHLLGEITERPVFKEQISNTADITNFNLAVKGLVLLIAILFIILGVKKSTIRRHEKLLYDSSIELKKVGKYFIEKEETLSKAMADEAHATPTASPNTTS